MNLREIFTYCVTFKNLCDMTVLEVIDTEPYTCFACSVHRSFGLIHQFMHVHDDWGWLSQMSCVDDGS